MRIRFAFVRPILLPGQGLETFPQFDANHSQFHPALTGGFSIFGAPMTFEELANRAAEEAAAAIAIGTPAEDVADAYLVTAAHIAATASDCGGAAQYLRNLANHLEQQAVANG